MFIGFIILAAMVAFGYYILKTHRKIEGVKAALGDHLDRASFPIETRYVDANGMLAIAVDAERKRLFIAEEVDGKMVDRVLRAEKILACRMIENGKMLGQVHREDQAPEPEGASRQSGLPQQIENVLGAFERAGVRINPSQELQNINTLSVELVTESDEVGMPYELYAFAFVKTDGMHTVIQRGSKGHRNAVRRARGLYRIFAQAIGDERSDASPAVPRVEQEERVGEPTANARDLQSEPADTFTDADTLQSPDTEHLSAPAQPIADEWTRQREAAFQSSKKG